MPRWINYTMLLDSIYELADNDLIVAECESGVNDYDMQFNFANKPEEVAKKLIKLSNDCTKNASEIREKVEHYQENKHQLQDTYYVAEVLKESQKVSEGRHPNPKEFIRDETVLLKREPYPTTISDDESDLDENEVLPGDMDTKFKYPKKNSNEELLHNYNCNDCEQVFHDTQELRNHQSNHHKELYRCMQCNTVCRSVRSYFNHKQTDHAFIYGYPYPDCDDTFLLKTSLRNHEQTHSNYRHTCKLRGCGKQFKFRSSYLEHITYRHRDSKSVECPVCKKMYWTPSSMRSHRAKIHGLVTEMFRGAL